MADKFEVTDKMLVTAMRAFEPLSSVLRYREKDKWHTCDMMAMRDAISAVAPLIASVIIPVAVDECAKVIESGAGMADLIDQDDLDEQARILRASVATFPMCKWCPSRLACQESGCRNREVA